MNAKLRNMMRLLAESPRRFPVELALGLTFFLVAAYQTDKSGWWNVVDETVGRMDGDVLWLYVPLAVLSFWLGRVNRWAYVASYFLFVPLAWLVGKGFFNTFGFAFTYMLAAILLFVGHKRMDNRTLGTHALHIGIQTAFGVLVAGVLTLAQYAIIGSFAYIFGLDVPGNLYIYIDEFIWFVIAPQVCYTFIRQGVDEDEHGAFMKVVRIILDFILSPAIIIYTVILYAYFIKIAVMWDLPKGGVAWMVMAFVAVALGGCLAQEMLEKRHYDWFYGRFTWIAIPPLIVYWIGSTYRIGVYDFTEARIYLMVAGVLMTLFVLMLAWRRTRRFQLMAIVLGAAVVLFTYIPGISARSFGLRCQTARMLEYAERLKLLNEKTGRFVRDFDVQKQIISEKSRELYKHFYSSMEYVQKEMGREDFSTHYGTWNGPYPESTHVPNEVHELLKPVNVGKCNVMLPNEDYEVEYRQGIVTVHRRDGQLVMKYPIAEKVEKKPELLNHPKELFVYQNDSLLLVLRRFWTKGDRIDDVGSYEFNLFRKQ